MRRKMPFIKSPESPAPPAAATPPSWPSGLFDNIAPRYDLVNLVISGGFVVYWDYRLRRALLNTGGKAASKAGPGPGAALDLGCGTLRLARGLMRRGLMACAPQARLVGLDLSPAMLAAGRSRLTPATRQRILAVRGEAQALPFADSSFEVVVSQFLWRNLSARPPVLAEIMRVLKPGGYLLVMEFGSGQRRIWGGLYNFYLTRLLPRLARLLSPQQEGYDYLVRSILAFPPSEAIAAEMRAAGFAQVEFTPLTSGIIFLHSARKPDG